MRREEFEKYLGWDVEIKLFDGDIVRGCLRKTQDEMFKHDVNLYLPKNLYFMTSNAKSKICNSCLFKTSHVKSVKFI